MTVQTGQTVVFLFTTRTFSTGVGINADATPTGTLYVNGTASGNAVTVIGVSTGLYKGSVVMPTLALGDEVEVIISATVGGISDKAVVWGDTNDLFLETSVSAIPTNPLLTTDTRLNNLDATISSRLAGSGYTTPPTVIQIRQELDSNSTKLANLDVLVSSRLPTISYVTPTTPPTVVQIRQELDTNSIKLVYLDTPISSRTVPFDITTALNTQGYTSVRAGYLDTLNGLVNAIWNTIAYGSTTIKTILASFRFTISNQVDANALTSVSSGGGGGSGTGNVTVTLTINDGTNPIQNANVNLKINSSIYYGKTNSSGNVTINPNENAGTYTVTVTASGYSGTTQTLTVGAGTTSQTYSLVAISVSPSTPPLVTGYLYCYDQYGNPQAGITHSLAISGPFKTNVGASFNATPQVVMSDNNGLVQFPGLVPGFSYVVARQNGSSAKFTAQAITFALPDLLGTN